MSETLYNIVDLELLERILKKHKKVKLGLDFNWDATNQAISLDDLKSYKRGEKFYLTVSETGLFYVELPDGTRINVTQTVDKDVFLYGFYFGCNLARFLKTTSTEV